MPDRRHHPTPDGARRSALAEDAPDSGAFRAAGLVSLTTDFGLLDPYVGALHGVLHACGARELTVVDLCHEVPPGDVQRAAFFLAGAYPYFPEGTVHVVVVDPGVGSERDVLLAVDRGHAFLAPDNGVLGPVLSEAAVVRRLDVARFALPRASRTFHGRDVFAPAAAALARGLDPAGAGAPTDAWQRAGFPEPVAVGAGELRSEVLFADRFGNLVTAVRAERLDDPSAWSVELGDQRLPVRGTYADTQPGELLALVDSYGYLEVAERDGSAARRLGLGPGSELWVRRRR